MMPVILPDDLLTVQLPQPRIVVGACGNQVGTICRESAVPDPALVARERGLERVGALRLGVLVRREGFHVYHLPDLGRVVGAAGGELLDVRRQEDAGYVLVVRAELGDGD